MGTWGLTDEGAAGLCLHQHLVAAEGAFGWLCSSQGVFGSVGKAPKGCLLLGTAGLFGSAVMVRLVLIEKHKGRWDWLRNSQGGVCLWVGTG
ncbi:hypothetical protein Tco_1372894 [Tanacetum coccineum]